MNSVDQDIKFTHEINWEENKVIFLNTTITLDSNGYLQTGLYNKPNAKNSLLLPSSCHPPGVVRAIVYGLALMNVRICSIVKAREQRLEELAARLRQRSYSEEVIQAGIARARAVPREEALKKVEKRQEGGGRQHRLVVEYDRRSSPALVTVLEANYQQMVGKDQRLARIFPRSPRPAYKRGKNIKELLCCARLPPARRMNTRTEGQEARNGLTRCNKSLGRNGCTACPFITSRHNQVIKSVKVHSTGQEIPVEGRINCKSSGGHLYLLWSSKDPTKQYLGSSNREPRERLREHRRDIINQRLEKAVPKHFLGLRSNEDDIVFAPFKRIRSSNRQVLLHFETKAINEFNLVEAGVNRILT